MKLIYVILIVGVCGLGHILVHGQPGRREPPTVRPHTTGPNTKGRKSRHLAKAQKPKAPVTASLIINASPSDTLLLMNGQQVEGSTLVDLKPGAYVLTARRVGYNEESRSITLIAGENEPITIMLDPLAGTLGVAPNVSGAQITVKKVESGDNQSTATFANSVVDLKLRPGEYEISISKDGYRAVTRTIMLQAAGSVYLEPQLSKWPAESKPAQPAAMIIQTSLAGKQIFVTLHGSSENAQPTGVLDVFVGETAQTPNRVSGLLPGFPCSVDFIPIENVNDFSFAERPEAGNGWKRVTVRVRPKNNKRPLHFAISWASIGENGTIRKVHESADPVTSSHLEPATVKRRILPSYPTAARIARTSGIVVVIVDINEKGKVVSAKAIEGQAFLRQSAENAARQWEFNPAKRNGVAVPDSQRVVFNFQP